MSYQPERAFTFVELIVVMAIVGILASMIVPNLRGSVSTWRSNRYANSVWSSLRNAKFKSIAEDRPVTVRFKVGQNSEVRFFISSNASGESATWSRITGLQPMSVPPDVEIASVGEGAGDKSGYICIEFEPDGTITEARESDATTRECTGSALGQAIIHISPAGVALTDSNTCLVSTIYLDHGQPNPIPQFMEYGAYDEFSAELGDEPC